MAPIGPWGSGFAADTLLFSAAAFSRRTSTVFLPSRLLDSKVRKRDQPNRAQAKRRPGCGTPFARAVLAATPPWVRTPAAVRPEAHGQLDHYRWESPCPE